MTKYTMEIKKGDEVKVLAGKERGKNGKVLEAIPKTHKVIIEGLNIHVRFSKPKRKGEKGQRLELPAPISVSKVMLICPFCAKPTRIAHEITSTGNKRKCKKCAKLI